jgi:hypothetical protein
MQQVVLTLTDDELPSPTEGQNLLPGIIDRLRRTWQQPVVQPGANGSLRRRHTKLSGTVE